MSNKKTILGYIIALSLIYVIEALIIIGTGILAAFLFPLITGIQVGVIDGALITLGLYVIVRTNYEVTKAIIQKMKK
jgi:preprotein translocase subunit SecF